MKQVKVLFILAFFCFFNANAQVNETLNIKNEKTDTIAPLRFSVPQLYAPGLLVAGSLATYWNINNGIKHEIVDFRNKTIPNFSTTIDNYLQFSPILIAYGLDAVGLKSKTNFEDRTVILIKGEVMMLGAVYVLKNVVGELRPDGSAFNSFPSGHTAQAFAAATFLSEEYKEKIPWMPYAAYGLASGVGVLRMANNRHYICDVLIGAGLGILSMKIAYWTHRYQWGKRKIIFNPSNN